MRLATADLLIAPLLPAVRGSAADADWARAFALARVGILGLAICALPIMLVAAPQALPGVTGLFVALVLSSAAGLIALRCASPAAAVLAATAGLAALAIGPLSAAAAPALLAAGVLVAAGDLLALPGARAGWPIRGAVALLAVAPGLAALGLDRFGGWDEVFAGAAPLLALAPLATLACVALSGRVRLADQSGQAASLAARGEALLAAADVAVAVVDRGGHVLDCTGGVGRLLSCDIDGLKGRGLIDRVLIADRPALLRAASQAAATGAACDLMLRLCVSAPDAGGREPPAFAPFQLRIAPFAGQGGEVAIRLERERPAAAETGASVDHEARLALLQQVGHEIRTPMNAVLGFSEVLVEAALAPKRPDQVVEYARIIHRSAREAFTISSGLLDLLRAEANGHSGVREPQDLAEIAAAAARLVNERAPVPVRIERAAGEVMLDVDGHACRTLLKAVLESFSTAFDGRSQVLCQIGRAGLAPQVVVTARNLAEAAPTGGASCGHFGIMEALAARLADQIGCRIALDLAGPALRAVIEFPLGAALSSPRSVRSQSPVPLRKSA